MPDGPDPAGAGQPDGRGTVEGPCPKCKHPIPRDTRTCPNCGYVRQFSQEQYDRLMRCSGRKDISEWNEWRGEHPNEPVLLEGARLRRAHLEGATLRRAHLEGANLIFAHLEGADLMLAHLERADLFGAHLKGALLIDAHLEGANLQSAHLEGVWAAAAIVDGETRLWGCTCDRRTNFTGVGLASARLEPALRARLEAHLERRAREMGWRQWYDSHWTRKWILSVPVRAFWWTSDYGACTYRILLMFLFLSFLFAGIYYRVGLAAPPGLVTDLFEVVPAWAAQVPGVEPQPVPHRLVPLRAVYFSVVTMTTLGFGDIRAHPQSYLGHVALMLQVFLGYVLLGALITRFAVMFQGTTVPHVLAE